MAELTDVLLHDGCVGAHHLHTPDPARLTVSRPSYIFRSGFPVMTSAGASGAFLMVVNQLALPQLDDGAVRPRVCVPQQVTEPSGLTPQVW